MLRHIESVVQTMGVRQAKPLVNLGGLKFYFNLQRL